jgi:uncharacterized UPF0160 family protein
MLDALQYELREELTTLTHENVVKAVTHNGKFHADEVMATAVLKRTYEMRGMRLNITRSRDPLVIAAADIVYDVGGEYSDERGRYDHHQPGALRRENGMTRSALGLIWLHYGEEYCEGDTRAAARIDDVLVRGIDARDNGELRAPEDADTADYGISQVIEQLNPIFEKGETYDGQFVVAVGSAAELLARLHDKVLVELKTEDAILAARDRSDDPRYAVMDYQVAPPDTLAQLEGFEYLVFPEHTNDTWQVYTIRTLEDPFVSKRPFPEAWAGLRDDKLAQLTGVDDALFCHTKRFLAVAKSREGALALLTKSLEQSEGRDS